MIRIWYFAEPEVGVAPRFICNASNPQAALRALCNYFGAHMFEGEVGDAHIAAMQKGSYIMELPCNSCCAVIVTPKAGARP